MPFLGIGLHVFVAIFFAVHVVRTGRELYWLIILFMFPLFGSIAYFFAVFLPQSRLERSALRAGTVIKKSLDPGRDLREAQRAFDLTPTAHNQMRLAAMLLDAGKVAEAVGHYEACLRGPFAGDAEIAFGAARAKLANNQAREAIELLAAVRAKNPGFRPQQVGLLLASAHSAAGDQDKAREEFTAMVERFGSVEARAEFAMWAIQNGQQALAERELKEIEHTRKHMTRDSRSLHQDLFKRLDAASARLR